MKEVDQGAITRIEEALQEYLGERHGHEIGFLGPAQVHRDDAVADWSAPEGRHRSTAERKPQPEPARIPLAWLSVSDLAEETHLPPLFLSRMGLEQRRTRDRTRAYVAVPYFDEQGHEIVAERRLCSSARGDRVRWAKGSRPVPYGFDLLSQARHEGYVWIVQGEANCWTMWYHDIPALGIPDGRQIWERIWKTDYAALLDGLDILWWQEPNPWGNELLLAAGPDLPHAAAFLAEQDFPDVSGLYQFCEYDSAEFIEAMALIREQYVDPMSKSLEAAQVESERLALRELLEDPDAFVRHSKNHPFSAHGPVIVFT